MDQGTIRKYGEILIGERIRTEHEQSGRLIKSREEIERKIEGRSGGTKLNCPNGIEFLPGIFIANALRVRRHFYETRNRVAHNRARRRIFPKAPPRAMKRGASKLGEEKNSTRAVFLFARISYLGNIY